jgi:hypothetical protein
LGLFKGLALQGDKRRVNASVKGPD